MITIANWKVNAVVPQSREIFTEFPGIGSLDELGEQHDFHFGGALGSCNRARGRERGQTLKSYPRLESVFESVEIGLALVDLRSDSDTESSKLLGRRPSQRSGTFDAE